MSLRSKQSTRRQDRGKKGDDTWNAGLEAAVSAILLACSQRHQANVLQSPFRNTGCWVKEECSHWTVYLFTNVLSLYSNYLLYRTLTAASKHSWIQWDFKQFSHRLCRAQSVGSQTWIKVCLQEKLHRKPLCWPLNKPPWSAVSESLPTHAVQPNLVLCQWTYILVQVKSFPSIQNMLDCVFLEMCEMVCMTPRIQQRRPKIVHFTPISTSLNDECKLEMYHFVMVIE